MASKIYVPEFNSGNCVEFRNGVLRVYETEPRDQGSYNYVDYYYDSHYIHTSGVYTKNNFGQNVTCISTDDITTNPYYRNDISDILISFFVIVIICFYFPYKIISRLFGRWLKL